jgi:3-oxoacyl-[acyl-carrier protein] reductase
VSHPRIALITGGGGRIGGAIADRLGAAGFRVAVVDAADEAARCVADRLTTEGVRSHAAIADVSDPPSVERVLDETARSLGGSPSVVVHAAGFGGPFQTTDEVTPEQWDCLFGVNVKGAFLVARRVLPAMRAEGWGRFIAIASIQGLVGARLSTPYVASKHALVGYVRAVAAEWGQFGITCNSVCPGYVQTPMGPQPDKREGHEQRIIERTPARRIASPDEIAAVVAFLSSDEARHVNGAAWVVDGGITADLGI